MSSTAVLALLSGYLGGTISSEWDPTLTFKMNLVGKVIDAFKFFPSQLPAAGIMSQQQKQRNDELIIIHRKNWELAGWIATRNLPSIGNVVDTVMKTRDGDQIRIRIYVPDTTNTMKPVLVYLHGGGFCFGGGFDVYEGVCRRLALACNVIVVAVDYRLAPEFRFPIPLHDCIDALHWVYGEPDVLKQVGGAPKQRGIALAGDSAGGNLASVTSVLCKATVPIRLQVLIYPCASAYSRTPSGIIQSHSSLAIHARAYVLPTAALAWLWDMYLENPEKNVQDPHASPVLFSLEELTGVAPAFLITADHDVLQDECIVYRDLLRKAGVPVHHKHCLNTFHGFINSDWADGMMESIKAISDELKHAFMLKSGGRL